MLAVILPSLAWGGDNIAVDLKFDKTGDGIVDATDWREMDAGERQAYVRASVEALGQDPDARLPGGKTRAQSYFEGLQKVYE